MLKSLQNNDIKKTLTRSETDLEGRMRALPYVLVAETTMPGPPPTTKTQEPFTSNKHPMNASTIRWRIKTMKILETQLNQPAPKTQ